MLPSDDERVARLHGAAGAALILVADMERTGIKGTQIPTGLTMGLQFWWGRVHHHTSTATPIDMSYTDDIRSSFGYDLEQVRPRLTQQTIRRVHEACTDHMASWRRTRPSPCGGTFTASHPHRSATRTSRD